MSAICCNCRGRITVDQGIWYVGTRYSANICYMCGECIKAIPSAIRQQTRGDRVDELSFGMVDAFTNPNGVYQFSNAKKGKSQFWIDWREIRDRFELRPMLWMTFPWYRMEDYLRYAGGKIQAGDRSMIFQYGFISFFQRRYSQSIKYLNRLTPEDKEYKHGLYLLKLAYSEMKNRVKVKKIEEKLSESDESDFWLAMARPTGFPFWDKEEDVLFREFMPDRLGKIETFIPRNKAAVYARHTGDYVFIAELKGLEDLDEDFVARLKQLMIVAGREMIQERIGNFDCEVYSLGLHNGRFVLLGPVEREIKELRKSLPSKCFRKGKVKKLT